MTLDTPRLTLRPVERGDHARLHELFTQPGVRRFLFDDRLLAPADVDDLIDKSLSLFSTRHFGLWLAHRRGVAAGANSVGNDDAATLSTGEPVGFGALWYFRDPPELELLYGVDDRRLHCGYGREIARAVIVYAFGSLGMREIRASTDTAHLASRRLLEALGFESVGERNAGGLPTAFYRLRPTSC